MSPLPVIRIPERRRAFVGGLVVLTSAIALIVLFPQLREYYHRLFLFQARSSLTFYLSFVALLLLASLTSIFPASLLGVLAGILFGLIKGFALSAGTIMLGAFISFVFSRYFFRAACRRLAAKVIDLDRLEDRLVREGWRYALLLRLAPLAPFSITSYVLGLSPIPLGQYLLTTLGSMPFLLVCVYLGNVGSVVIDAAGNIDGRVLWRLVVMLSIAVAAVAAVVHWLPMLMRRLLTPGGTSRVRPKR